VGGSAGGEAAGWSKPFHLDMLGFFTSLRLLGTFAINTVKIPTIVFELRK